MNRARLIKMIGSPVPAEIMVTEDQGAGDIMRRISIKHKKTIAEYDRISLAFDGGTVMEICQSLFNFCKRNIEYVEETIDVQNISAPQTILQRGYCDCKGYALFIAGVLDALKRRGRKINWFYRFASYKIFDETPGHVFVVVQKSGSEIWIDPVLKYFDEKKPYCYHVDRRVSTPVAIAGCGCSGEAIGATTKEVGQIIQKISPVLAYIPVVGWIAAAAGEVIGFFLVVFGSDYHTSTGVRWLVQMFEFFALSENVTSDNKVNEADTANAQNWFSYVLGVPVYDKYRWHALRGTDPETGLPLHKSHLERASDFLLFPEIQKAGVTLSQAEVATYIADNMVPSLGRGGWAYMKAAPAVIDRSGNVETAGMTDAQKALVDSGNQITNQNSWVVMAAAAVAIFFVLTAK